MNLTGLKLKMRKLNIGKIKAFLILVVMFPGALTIMGEDKVATKEKITEIKLNDEFLFGEGMSDDKEIAYGIAIDDLLSFANEVKDRNSQAKISISDLITKTETLVYDNGSRYEVIVYIPVKLIIEPGAISSSEKNEINVIKPGSAEVKKEPEIEDSATIMAEVQPIEEVTIEEEPAPLIEQENIQEIQQENIQENQTENRQDNQPEIQQENRQDNQPEIQQEIRHEIQPENIQENLPENLVKNQTENQQPEDSMTRFNLEYDGEIEKFLLTQDNFSEIKSFLSDMKRNGKIVETGATDSPNNLPQDANLILMDGLGGILAILSPSGGQGRINYKTQKSDSENNYNSKFIVWYRK